MKIKDNYVKYFVLLVPVVWGFNPAFMKIAYKYIDPFFMNFIRLFLALIFSLIYTKATGKLKFKDIKKISSDNIKLMIFFASFQLFFSLGISYLPAGITGIIFGLLPVTVLIINTFRGLEKSSVKIVLSVFISLVGVFIIVISGNKIGNSSISIIGVLFIFLAQVSYGMFTIESKKKINKYNPIVLSTISLIPSTLIFFIFSINNIFVFNYFELPLEAWLSILYSGVFAIGIANAIWMWGVGKIGSTKVALYSNLNPVAAIFAGFLLLGETINIIQFFGILIIFSAILLSQSNIIKKQI